MSNFGPHGSCTGWKPAPPVSSRCRRLLVVFVCILACACGRKAAPRPPEDVVPQTISDLAAVDTPDGIQLTWSRPNLYADGDRMVDLAGFEIQRATGSGVFERLATLEVSDRDRFRKVKRFRYLDRDLAPAARVRYRVVSFTLDRYFSVPSNVATVEHQATHEQLHAPLPTPRG